MPEDTKKTRERWLRDFMALALPVIKSRTGLSPTKPVEISVGFPTNGGKRRKNGNITAGQCLLSPNRKHHHIFIHPYRSVEQQEDVGETIMHELLHASLPAEVGHRREFSQAAKKLGMVGKPTSTELSPELRERVKEIIAQIGDYPHAESVETTSKPQTTRLLKVMCPVCGYTARITAKWLDEAGTPICPQDLIPFIEAGVGEEASSPLTVKSQVVEYQVLRKRSMVREARKAGINLSKFDERFFIQMRRYGADIDWSVIDYGSSIDERGIAVLGVVTPRHYHATSKEDALSLVEGLQNGMDPKDARDVEDIDVTAIDDDPDLDTNFEGDYEGDDEGETFDFEDEDSDPRFQWEKDRGIPAESINPDDEAERREGWVER